MKTILIVNANIVNDGEIRQGDVYIKEGRIEQVGKDLSTRSSDVILDAQGKVLLPGLIDDQVHFREPGLTHKGDILSESRAAVAGGITGYMEMPNTQPSTTTRPLLEEKFAAAAGRSFANYSFYLGATNDNIEEIKARRGRVIAVADAPDAELERLADHIIQIPTTHELLLPLLTVIPLQLLAYHIAVLRDCHVDQPRNLAKSVTVE